VPPTRIEIIDAPPEIAHGVIQAIDLIDREVIVRQEAGPMTYSVSGNCEVILNGERVKLRMLQPRDHVRIACRRRREGLVALSLEAVTRRAQMPSVAPNSDRRKV